MTLAEEREYSASVLNDGNVAELVIVQLKYPFRLAEGLRLGGDAQFRPIPLGRKPSSSCDCDP
jgi:hypothetical protein